MGVTLNSLLSPLKLEYLGLCQATVIAGWEVNGDAGAAPGAIGEPERAAVQLNDLPRDGQAEPGALTDRLGGKERFEKFPLIRFGDASALVVDLDGQPRAIEAAAQGQRAVFRAGLNRIQKQVEERLLQFVPVEQDHRRRRAPCADHV